MKKDLPKNKIELRQTYHDKRKVVPIYRHKEAREDLLKKLDDLISSEKVVLSYSPLPEEVDVGLVNQKLAARGGLALPKIENNQIFVYLVKNLERDLQKGKFGILEPIRKRCEYIELVDIALIPGIAFDRANNRLGFGMGYYDRFLTKMKEVNKIGIAFKEQITDELIDVTIHDIPMDQLCIV